MAVLTIIASSVDTGECHDPYGFCSAIGVFFFFGIYFLWVLNVVPFTSKPMHNVVAHLVSSLPHWIVQFFILWLQYVGNSVTAVPCHITIWHSLTQTHIHAHGSASAGAILPLTMTTHPITNNRVTNQKIFTLMHTTFAGKRDTYARNTHTHTQKRSHAFRSAGHLFAYGMDGKTMDKALTLHTLTHTICLVRRSTVNICHQM